MIPLCFFCGQKKNEIALFGKLPNDAEAPQDVCLDHRPCDNCKDLMERGIMLIEVTDDCPDAEHYRTGRMVVVTEEFIARTMTPEAADLLLQRRACFVRHADYEKFGFPDGNVDFREELN